jgi:hypothetical protein
MLEYLSNARQLPSNAPKASTLQTPKLSSTHSNSSCNHGFMAIALNIIILICIKPQFNASGEVFLAIACGVFCPRSETDKTSDRSISSLVLALQDGLVHSICDGLSEVWVQDCSKLWLKLIVIENEQSHRSF